MKRNPEQFRVIGLTLIGVAAPLLYLFLFKNSLVLVGVSAACCAWLGFGYLKTMMDKDDGGG